MKVPVAVPVDSVSIDGVSVGTQYQLIQYQKISTSGFSTSDPITVYLINSFLRSIHFQKFGVRETDGKWQEMKCNRGGCTFW
jgi:hypothetical protein